MERTLRATFQVGPITRNKVSNSQTLRYMEQAQAHLDNSSAYSEELFSEPLHEIENMGRSDSLDGVGAAQSNDPLDEIEHMQGGDSLDEIDQMLKSD